MIMKRQVPLCRMGLLLLVVVLASCGAPSEQESTLLPSATPLSQPTNPPAEITNTPAPLPSHTPTASPTPEPQIVTLRGVPGC